MIVLMFMARSQMSSWDWYDATDRGALFEIGLMGSDMAGEFRDTNSVRRYINRRLVYRTSESTSFSKRHRYEILTSTCTAFYSFTALAARVFFNPPFKGSRLSNTCCFVISMIVAVDSSCKAFC